MKAILITILTITTCYFSFSQEYTYEFGKPTNTELQIESYDKDKDASAMVLYDIGKTSIIENKAGELILKFEHRIKVKIFNQGGYEHAEIELPYYVKGDVDEKISDIVAYTYNLTDGQIQRTRLDPSKIFEEVIDDRYKVKKFALPGIKDGSVFEYRYTFTSPYLTDYRDWDFQQNIPVKYSKYTVLMNPFYSYVWHLQGTNKIDSFKEYKDSRDYSYAGVAYKHMVYEFVKQDIPAFYDESFITSRDDYIMRINFQLAEVNLPNGTTIKYLSTWPKLTKKLLNESNLGKFKNAIERKANVLIEEIDLQDISELKKVEVISDYVKNNYTWNEYLGYSPSQNVKEFLTKKSGNCTEINLLLTGLLNNAGISAYPVLISTRKNGKIKIDYPYLESFNYLAVYTELSDGNVLIIDGTEKNLPFHILPARCINDNGLVLNNKEEMWVSLASNQPSIIKYNLKFNLNEPADSLNGQIAIISTGYDAFKYRKTLHDDYNAQKNYFNKRALYIPGKIRGVNYSNKNKPYTLASVVSSPVENIFDKTYISPFAKIPIEENPLKLPERKYPVDLTFPKKRSYYSSITIPDGYEVDFLPKAQNIIEKDFSLNYSASVNNNTIVVSAEYEFKKAVFEPEEYNLLKYYFNQIIKKFNEKVVLKKTED